MQSAGQEAAMLQTIARSFMLATYMEPRHGAPRRRLPREADGDYPRLGLRHEDQPFQRKDAGNGHD